MHVRSGYEIKKSSLSILSLRLKNCSIDFMPMPVVGRRQPLLNSFIAEIIDVFWNDGFQGLKTCYSVLNCSRALITAIGLRSYEIIDIKSWSEMSQSK